MTPAWAYLSTKDRETFRATISFLNKRLEEQETLNWALNLRLNQRIERIAIADILTGGGVKKIAEPWASAWRLVKESWAKSTSAESSGGAIYGIQSQLRAGDRSGALIQEIVELVAPRLTVNSFNRLDRYFDNKPRKPRKVEDVLSASITSGDLVDLTLLDLPRLNDVQFLTSLANALEAAVNHGLDIARRLGWNEKRSFSRLGFLNRVYYTQEVKRDGGIEEVDAYNKGIAPSVKLLHSVVTRMSELDATLAKNYLQRWRLQETRISLRLWAAFARRSEMVSICDVASLLKTVDDQAFWDLSRLPELAEMRAVRFKDMDGVNQKVILTRIHKGPPRNKWPRNADASEVDRARLYWSLRELRRIEIAAGVLPARSKIKLDSNLLQFSELSSMTLDEGLSEIRLVQWTGVKPDGKFDALSGIERLKALETALKSPRKSWEDNPSESANDWVHQHDNAALVIADLQTTTNGGNDFPKVWSCLGWAYRPSQQNSDQAQEVVKIREAEAILEQLHLLSESTLSDAIDGISSLLDAWSSSVANSPLILPIWLSLWPIAVAATNNKADEISNENLTVVEDKKDDEADGPGSDSLNTCVGKLTGVFIDIWRAHSGPQNPFSDGSVLRQMRDTLIKADGRSGLLVRYRLIEYLPYFLEADPDWANEFLIAPLKSDDPAALALWRAVARRTHFTKVLNTIGEAMAERANDRRLGRETRRQLVFSLVIEALHAFRENREVAVPNQRLQQLLRTLDDEVRASAANAIQIFIRDLSAKSPNRQNLCPPGELFRTTAAKFLQTVWPQERSLATPGVSSALADLPATSGDAFAEAVEAISRFLVPFECWSILDYGLYGDADGKKKLAIIATKVDAEALLRLLDLTVGISEGAVVPHDLTDALDQIRSVAPTLADSPSFRRLATIARR